MAELTIPPEKEAEFEYYKSRLLAQAGRVTIASEEDAGKAADLARYLHEAIESVETEQTRLTLPFRTGVAQLDERFNEYKGQLKTALAHVKQSLLAYYKTLGNPSVATRGEYGSVASPRSSWTFDVENIGMVPQEYLTVNEAAVRKAISNGVREIPGLNIRKSISTITVR